MSVAFNVVGGLHTRVRAPILRHHEIFTENHGVRTCGGRQGLGLVAQSGVHFIHPWGGGGVIRGVSHTGCNAPATSWNKYVRWIILRCELTKGLKTDSVIRLKVGCGYVNFWRSCYLQRCVFTNEGWESLNSTSVYLYVSWFEALSFRFIYPSLRSVWNLWRRWWIVKTVIGQRLLCIARDTTGLSSENKQSLLLKIWYYFLIKWKVWVSCECVQVNF